MDIPEMSATFRLRYSSGDGRLRTANGAEEMGADEGLLMVVVLVVVVVEMKGGEERNGVKTSDVRRPEPRCGY